MSQRRLADALTITRVLIDSLDLSTRSTNILANNFIGASVGELRAALADRRRPILHCGAVSTAEILDAVNGDLCISPEAAERRVTQIKADAEARISRLRTRAAKHMGVEWRP